MVKLIQYLINATLICNNVQEYAMSRIMILAVIALSVLCILPLAGDRDVLDPGAIRIVGRALESQRLRLEVAVRQGDTETLNICGVKIYSEPSHSLLGAIVDPDTPAEAQERIRAEKPSGMVVTTIRDQIEPNFEIKPPPVEDNRILVEYVLRSETGVVTHTVRDVYIPNGLRSFGFVTGARLENVTESWVTNCYCDGVYCKTITCGTPEMTLCCPNCTCFCGHVQCPK